MGDAGGCERAELLRALTSRSRHGRGAQDRRRQQLTVLRRQGGEVAAEPLEASGGGTVEPGRPVGSADGGERVDDDSRHAGQHTRESAERRCGRQRLRADDVTQVLEKAGKVRDGGSYEQCMGGIACWNAIMDENTYMVQKWNEFVAA